ncbi:calcium-binding protein [Methylopila sp. Yamaguchi]|uniref:calcium-binding protein n=1 Tax=Methylopila sp. Yamaguchi TaxID=1437817 RepID=UPI000CA872B2|nr:calcium-binding protein [Methylopila sp. Yamaguchi]GBD47190.1 hemolysin-type calcium-binding protein [Methylopila sp. Yamaguchi]
MAVIRGTDDNDWLESGGTPSGPNELLGLGGADTLWAARDGDTLRGGDGADFLAADDLDRVVVDGGAGDDTILAEVWSGDQVTIDGGDGVDTLVGARGYYLNSQISNIERIEFYSSANIYLLGSQLEALDVVFVGGRGDYGQLWLVADPDRSSLDASSLRFEGEGHFQTVLNGRAGSADRIVGSDYDDLFLGGGGGDRLIGGLGNDFYSGVGSNDVIVERADGGYDGVFADVDWRLGANIEELGLKDGVAVSAIGNALDNLLRGNSNANIIIGRGGADTMRGGAGDDVYTVDSSDDVVEEAKKGGVDTVRTTADFALGSGQEIEILRGLGDVGLQLRGNAFANTILGSNGDDLLRGYSGADWLKGGGGDDTLMGGLGVDTLDGGAGADSFCFAEAPNGDVDVIRTFDAAEDHIMLDDAAFTAFTKGATTAADIYEHLLFDARTGEIAYDAEGDGGWVVFARLQHLTGVVDATSVIIV